jgi:hypothetical protein
LQIEREDTPYWARKEESAVVCVHRPQSFKLGVVAKHVLDKIRLTFELCNERKVFKEGDEAKLYSLYREFTYSFGAKTALRPFVEGMTGSTILDDEWPDLEKMLDDACLLNVVHDSKGDQTYTNIQGASPLPKGMEVPQLFNDKRLTDINSTPWEVIGGLPEFIQKKMQSSEEWVLRENFERGNVKNFRPNVAKGEELLNDEGQAIPF